MFRIDTDLEALESSFKSLAAGFDGSFNFDKVSRILYATDASAYREKPLAVAIPKTKNDLKKLINFANKNKITLIPRTAGTSLAGQVVGKGIIIDLSVHFNKVLSLDIENRTVTVQPGVVRDELNHFLKPKGLFFGPETSTANRAMIGGMVGNNSCGSNSIVYGSTRTHLKEVKGFLSDGSEVIFGAISKKDAFEKMRLNTLEGNLYKHIFQNLNNPEVSTEIRAEFPKRSIERRNTGYAIDELLETSLFEDQKEDFNFCKLIAGSEGTLMLIEEITLNISELPPPVSGLVCIHFNNVAEALQANLIALKYQPYAVELIDHYILECTKENKEQAANRFFVQGDPGAILVVDISKKTQEEVVSIAKAMETEMRAANLGFHFPLLFGDDTKKIWTLRKAGLGLLSNLPGDEKAVAVIEDTAVDVNDLPAFIAEFNVILSKNNMSSVHYAHAGSGEIHLRPIINLKTAEGHAQFRLIAEEISRLVKKYKGSLSGEHGDGRLRGEFIKEQIGEANYALIKDVKKTWDPNNIFNAGKITDTPPMDAFLRYEKDQKDPVLETSFRFTNQTLLQHAEQCNGSGDCRKTEISGGTMCPSYMATKDEKHTTRARANILREMITYGETKDALANDEIKEVMDLCLLCKGCKSECPSNVDMAKLKMEFLYQYQKKKGVPLRSLMIANFSKLNAAFSYVPWLWNLIFDTTIFRKIANRVVGFHPNRSIPLLSKQTFKKWTKNKRFVQNEKQLYLFIDEFTNYLDVEVGIAAVEVLEKCGYQVLLADHSVSGRPQLSKGLLDDARKIANDNVNILWPLINETTPLVGIEPSTILTFRDEYPDLVDRELEEKAKDLSKHCFTFEEFIAKEKEAGRIRKELFTTETKTVKVHGHCQQKAIGSMVPTKKALSLPQNYKVELIPSGCCGMSGSFGYEKEHYDISMKIGELVLFPTIRALNEDVIISAAGTSCRHQIHDGTAAEALHPAQILRNALI